MGDGHRMVRRSGKRFQQRDPHAGFDRGGEEDLAEELGIDGAAATKGEEETPRAPPAPGPGS